MNISKVYYEELKSKCVNGKWESVRIGAEVNSEENMGMAVANHTPEYCLSIAKDFVRTSMNKECGYDVEKNKEVKKMVNELNKEIQCLLATL